jgi:hypothetical protein
MTKLTLDRLKQVLLYDPESGVFTWRMNMSSRARTGDVAGSPHGSWYIRIRIDDVLYYAHRLAWFYMTHEWPEQSVDHIDGDKTNTRYSNLRHASCGENSQNMRVAMGANRHSRLLGVVSRTLKSGRIVYVAHITLSKKQKHIGVFKTPDLAHAAYVSEKRKLHPFGTL